MDDPLPVGMGLRVPDPGPIPAGAYLPKQNYYHPTPQPAQPQSAPESELEVGPDGLVDFDVLSKVQVSHGLVLARKHD